MVTVKEKYGFLPTSVKEYENVPRRFKHLDNILDINLIRQRANKDREEERYGVVQILFNVRPASIE